MTLLYCHNRSSGHLLFDDPECTRLFVDHMLMSPRTAVQRLDFADCAAFAFTKYRRPLKADIRQNTTMVELISDFRFSSRRFIQTILQRNLHSSHVHDMLRMTTMLPTPFLPTLQLTPQHAFLENRPLMAGFRKNTTLVATCHNDVEETMGRKLGRIGPESTINDRDS
jgi:hypothetical protein